MPRPNYGPEAKRRAQQCLTLLLDFANDELVCRDVAKLEFLQDQIQIHWQSETQFVVRTKLRFLETLSSLADLNAALTADQLKEALRRLEDFLGILEDNRTARKGSETWHFTIKLWYSRRDRAANLHRFEQEWEQRRPQKSQQISPTAPPTDLWWQRCRHMLESQHCHRLTTNPLTVSDGIAFELDDLYVPLGVVAQKQQARRDRDISPDQGSQLYEPDDSDDTEILTLAQFLQHLLQPKPPQRLAIVGEPGAGKTTLLQQIAAWLLQHHALPIWVSLADLQDLGLEQYLLQDWLKAATRQVIISTDLQAEFGELFAQGRVWLLLDAVDEMAMDASLALTALARQLRTWLGEAHVVLACRTNVWYGSKNTLETFTTYRNLTFRYSHSPDQNQVQQFIQRWFQQQPELGVHLQAELSKPDRRRIRDMVKNPLRLALLCHSWSITQGNLPSTKATLYQLFTATIYEWKQDRIPTTPAVRQQLNGVLGQLALRALAQETTKFRLRQHLIHAVFGAQAIALLPLALKLGWLNQVGVSTNSGEKVYAFYHPTFQEYFAAQAIADWQFFLQSAPDIVQLPIFAPHWREVILLWLGRADLSTTDKDALIQALIEFDDHCGQFYHYQAYCLAAAGLAEFPESRYSSIIVNQLVLWRFGHYDPEQDTWSFAPTPLQELARTTLIQTDRSCAIAGLEAFIQAIPNCITRWLAAYSLGKVFDPGNAIAIAALREILQDPLPEALTLQIAHALGKVDPGHPTAIAQLQTLIANTRHVNIRRKAAYYLGKIDPGNQAALQTLTDLSQTALDPNLRRQAAHNLLQLKPVPEQAIAPILPNAFPRQHRRSTDQRSASSKHRDPAKAIAALEQQLTTTSHLERQRRLACQLGKLQPGHPQAVEVLLTVLRSEQATSELYQKTVEHLKEILLPEQWAIAVTALKQTVAVQPTPRTPQAQAVYQLLWYVAQQLPYPSFLQAWQQG